MIRKILLSVTTVIISCWTYSANAFSGGSGSVQSPYKIADVSDFQQIPDNSTDYYILVNDIIDVIPLSKTFKGHLDGQGYSISINYEYTCTSKGKYLLGGLFQQCIGAEISNLTVKGTININATYSSGTYKDNYWYRNNYSGLGDDVDVYLKEAEIGGICANAKSSVFTNCKIECNISWTANSSKNSSNSRYTYELLSNNSSVGGIAGYATDCEFLSSSVNGKLKVHFINATSGYWSWEYSQWGYVSSKAGNNKCGGIVGYADNCKIKNTLFSGIIESRGGSYIGVGSSSMLGGFVGYSDNSTIQCSYYKGTFLDNEASRIFGCICGNGYLNADQCFAISNNEDMFASYGSITKCYTTNTSDSETEESTVDVTLLSLQSWYSENLPDWDFVNVWYMPTVENGLPLLSTEPKISFEGDFYYGGYANINSQNIHKGIILETKNPDEVNITNNRVQFKKTGEIVLTIRQEVYGEYRKIQKELSFNVDKVDLKISIEPSTSIYGDEIPEFKLKYEGFIFDDDASSLNLQPKLLCDATSSHNVGDYPIIIQGGEAENYNISCSNGLHTILPRSLNVTPQDCTRKYGSNNPTLRIVYDGFVNGDNENIVSTPPNIQTTADRYSDTGTYSILCNGGIVSKNYTFKYCVGTLTIEKANLNITAVDAKREEGQSNPKFELTFEGFRNNDGILDLDELPSILCDANISSLAGIYPIRLSGGYDNNYEYILKDGQLIVEEKAIVILVESILLNSYLWEAHPGDVFQLVANIQPNNATTTDLNWNSSNEMVASVDKYGIITAHSEGNCLITVSSTDGTNIINQCKVSVSSEFDSISEITNAECYDIYNMQGTLLKQNASKEEIKQLLPGIYIIRYNNMSNKIVI